MRDVRRHEVRCVGRSRGRKWKGPGSPFHPLMEITARCSRMGFSKPLLDREALRATAARVRSADCGGFNVRLEHTIEQREDVEAATL